MTWVSHSKEGDTSKSVFSTDGSDKAISDKYSAMGRFVNLMFIVNATLFITSRLIITRGYWFCLVAAVLYLAVYVIMLSPWTNLRSRKVYLTLFWLVVAATFLSVDSFVYWYQHDAATTVFIR